MQTEYAIAGVSDKQLTILVFEIGVSFDEPFLQILHYLQKNLCYFRFAESFLLVSALKISHLSANVNPVMHKKIRYIDAPDFHPLPFIYGDFSATLHGIDKKTENREGRGRGSRGRDAGVSAN